MAMEKRLIQNQVLNSKLITLLISTLISLVGCSEPPVDQPYAYSEVCLTSGYFTQGSDEHYTEELPKQQVFVEGFCIDSHEVTIGQFADFVKDTGYQTLAETGPSRSDYPSAPDSFFQPGSAIYVFPTAFESGYWTFNPQASWQNPRGDFSSVPEQSKHPVTHIALKDAQAYAKWLGRRLPSEKEWEYAAKFNQQDSVNNDDTPKANIWHGIFPHNNTLEDGYLATAPVMSYAASSAGLYDMIGNVWEWTADPYNKNGSNHYTIKGGSHLCAKNACARYRPSARQPQEIGLGTSHVGFRTVRDIGSED